MKYLRSILLLVLTFTFTGQSGLYEHTAECQIIHSSIEYHMNTMEITDAFYSDRPMIHRSVLTMVADSSVGQIARMAFELYNLNQNIDNEQNKMACLRKTPNEEGKKGPDLISYSLPLIDTANNLSLIYIQDESTDRFRSGGSGYLYLLRSDSKKNWDIVKSYELWVF